MNTYVILTDKTLNPFSKEFLLPVLNNKNVRCLGVILNNSKPQSALKKIVMEFKKKRGFYIIIMILKSILKKLSGIKNNDAKEFYLSRDINIFTAKSLYDEATINHLKSLKPDFIIRNGFGIIKDPILSISRLGVLSYHHGDIRKYRGQPPAFWELYNNEREMAVTVQVLNSGIDNGKIVKQAFFEIHPTDTWYALTTKIYAGSQILMNDAVNLLTNKDFVPKVLSRDQFGALFTTPNFRQWFTMQCKVFYRSLLYNLKGLK